jgi:hypothetical protein
MRLSYLASAYQDELIYSRLARTKSHLGLENRAFMTKIFEEKNCLINFHFGSHLLVVQEVFGKDFFDIQSSLAQNSMLPFLSNFLSSEATQELKNNIIQGVRFNPAAIIYRDYKYCPLCSYEDRKDLGETYWRRTFGVSCWDVCSEHGCYLIRIPIKLKNFGELHIADDVIPKQLPKANFVTADELNIAKRITSIVKGESTFSTEVFLKTLSDKNLIYSNKFETVFSRARTKFVRSLSNSLPDLVNKAVILGCKRLIDDDIFSVYDPVILLLTEYFVESRDIQSFSIKNKSYVPQDCRCGTTSEQLQIFHKYSGKFVTQTVFCPNCEFTYYASKGKYPLIIVDYGILLPKTVSDMRKKGYSFMKIAKQLKLSHPRILNIKEGRYKRNFINDLLKKRAEMRQRFKALTNLPFTERSLEYIWLTQYDREWLFSQPRARMHSRWQTLQS